MQSIGQILLLLLPTLCWSLGLAHAQNAQLLGKLNPNLASLYELQLLPGIGPVKAAQILQRRQNRPLRELSDLKGIKGMGAKNLKRLEPYLTFDEPSTLRLAPIPRSQSHSTSS